MFQLIYPTHGRGAWASAGGTLSDTGTAPGEYYRSPAPPMFMPGLAGYNAVKSGQQIDINSYAVHVAIKGIQREIGAVEDGLFGPATGAALTKWQGAKGLTPDGIFGPVSAKAMFRPIAISIGKTLNTNVTVAKLTCGHIGFESSWDPGAVGYVEPRDLGLGQINGSAHSNLTPEFRLTPRLAIGFVANFALGNLQAMLWNERDGVAAYNLGVGGARNWVAAGRPDVWHDVDVKAYIDGVLAAAA